jgi:hypothetical protein
MYSSVVIVHTSPIPLRSRSPVVAWCLRWVLLQCAYGVKTMTPMTEPTTVFSRRERLKEPWAQSWKMMKARTENTAIMSAEATPSGHETDIARSVRIQPPASPAAVVTTWAQPRHVGRSNPLSVLRSATTVICTPRIQVCSGPRIAQLGIQRANCSRGPTEMAAGGGACRTALGRRHDLAALDARFAELRDSANVSEVFDPETEDLAVPPLLRAGLESWMRERGDANDGPVFLERPLRKDPPLRACLRMPAATRVPADDG